MKTKLSPMEELKLRKTLLREESNMYKNNLSYNWEYTKTHFGRLLLGSTISSTKSGLSDVFSLITRKEKEPSTFSAFMTNTGPVIWNIAQPMLVGLIIKRIKSLFKRKKKKK